MDDGVNKMFQMVVIVFLLEDEIQMEMWAQLAIHGL